MKLPFLACKASKRNPSSPESHTPLTSATRELITVVPLCVSPQGERCKLLRHLITIQWKYSSSSCLFVSCVNFDLPEALGGLLDYLLRFSNPGRRSHEDVLTHSLLFLAPHRHCLDSVCSGRFPSLEKNHRWFNCILC